MIFPKIEYVCPYCDTHYTVYNGERIEESKYKQLKGITEKQQAIGRCRACKRRDPNIPTTFEMDGLLTQEDILNRNKVMRQCKSCNKWTQMKTDENVSCSSCGSINYDVQSTKNLRTYNPSTDNRRKPKK